jgi:hypothetical protein
MKRLPNPSAVVVSALRPLVLLFLAAATASAQGTFHGDVARTGVYPEAGDAGDRPVEMVVRRRRADRRLAGRG